MDTSITVAYFVEVVVEVVINMKIGRGIGKPEGSFVCRGGIGVWVLR